MNSETAEHQLLVAQVPEMLVTCKQNPGLPFQLSLEERLTSLNTSALEVGAYLL